MTGLTLSVSGLPAGLTATDNGDGTVTISGIPTTSGAVTFSVTATDAGGNTASVNVALTIDHPAPPPPPVNQAPVATVATLNSVQIEEDQRWEYTSPPGVFSDDGGAENLTLTFTGLQTRSTGAGVLRIERRVNANGSFTIIVPAGYILVGSQNITFTISDGQQTATTSLALTVVPKVVAEVPEQPTSRGIGGETSTAGQSVDNPEIDSVFDNQLAQRDDEVLVTLASPRASQVAMPIGTVLSTISDSSAYFDAVKSGGNLSLESTTFLLSHYGEIFGENYPVQNAETYADALSTVFTSTSRSKLVSKLTTFQMGFILEAMKASETRRSPDDNRLSNFKTLAEDPSAGLSLFQVLDGSSKYEDSVIDAIPLVSFLKDFTSLSPKAIDTFQRVHAATPTKIKMQDQIVISLLDEGNVDALRRLSKGDIYIPSRGLFGYGTSKGSFQERYPEIYSALNS